MLCEIKHHSVFWETALLQQCINQQVYITMLLTIIFSHDRHTEWLKIINNANEMICHNQLTLSTANDSTFLQ